MNRIAAIVAGLSLAFVGTSETIAATIHVPGDYATIQGAIDASSDGDVISIAAGIHAGGTLDPNGKAITIQGTLNGDGTLATTINANLGNNVFEISSGEGEGTVIKDLVLTGGRANGWGGGIKCSFDSSPTITNCRIFGNTSFVGGGGIYCYDSNPTITNCTITGNTAQVMGGGIHCAYNSSPTITNCTISDNTANSIGGGIACDEGSSPTISGCTIEGNWSINPGGGIFCNAESSPTISDCTIKGNTSDLFGGGIYCDNSATVTISGSLFCENEPDHIDGNYSDGGGNEFMDECPLPASGACCLGGTCITATESDCTAAGGSYAGDGVACAAAGCATPPVTGACCVSSGCVSLSSDDCTAMGGNWLGEDGSCDDCPPTCDGDTNSDGVIDIEDLLNMLGSWGASC